MFGTNKRKEIIDNFVIKVNETRELFTRNGVNRDIKTIEKKKSICYNRHVMERLLPVGTKGTLHGEKPKENEDI